MLLSRTLGQPLAVILAMDSADYEIYKAEYARCPWDPYFKQTKDTYMDAPSIDDLERLTNPR